MAKNKKEEKKDVSLDADTQLINQILNEREYFLNASAGKRTVWNECWKMYVSWIDTTINPFLANLFIPKTHEAVEMLSAFLMGSNQTIKAEAEGKEDTNKALVVSKYLDFVWRKTLKIKSKLATWIKQAILFGNGVMKVGWADGKPWVEVIPLSDVYFDYYLQNIQDSTVIHRVFKKVEDVKSDENYNEERKNVISSSEYDRDETHTKFATYDDTVLTQASDDTVEIFERWTLKEVITIAPTASGYKIIKREDNTYKDADGNPFIPFVKVRLKNNPLPNRGYDYGAIEPTIKIQKAFNDLMNEFFDNVSLINHKMWIKRQGANINPMDLVRRPGGVITVSDINNDLKTEEVSDVKPSILQALTMLDNEFQQASMVINLLKGIPGSETATEASIGQQNVQTMLDMIDQNIKEALSELGQMILDITLQHIDEKITIKIFDNEKSVSFMEFDPSEIEGKYDISIFADRASATSRVVRQKQLLDFLNIISRDQMTMQKYPELSKKIYSKWLEEAGIQDADFFFEERQQSPQDIFAAQSAQGTPEALRTPMRAEGLQPNVGAMGL